MSPTILLYGADEYLGRLFVDEAVAAWKSTNATPKFTLVLGGRNAARAKALGLQYGLEVRQLELGQPAQLATQLADVAVLVNAASPFIETGVVLARAALEVGCHAVDLNPEVDVFLKLEALAPLATQSALVLSAGPGAVASALMVDAAVRILKASGVLVDRCIGAIRLGLECVPDASQSSVASVWRALSRDVTIMRAVTLPAPGGQPGKVKMCRDHVPIGQLERQFDFAVKEGAAPVDPDRRIASAANLVDTLASSRVAERLQELAGTVESYVSITTPARLAYPLGAGVLGICTPLAASTGIDDPLARCAAELMSSAPPESHGKCGHTIVLEMENEERTRVVDWRLRTPDFYLAGARAAVAVTEAVADGGRVGLVSPAEVLLDGDCDLFLVPPKYGRALRDCFLDKRVLV